MYLLIIVSTAVACAVFLTVTARSLDVSPLSESHKERIVANCTSAKSSLQQLHRSDASLRVNRGQLYEFISTKLMARLNSRLVLNRLDASDLVAAAARYEQSLSYFRTTYQTYEEQLSALLRIDCQRQPEAFYYRALDVRQKRQAVAEVTSEIERYVVEYHQTFERFTAGYQAATREESP